MDELTDSDNFDDQQDRIQRILNEKKKQDLEEQYSMSFYESHPNLPPETEGEFLDYVAEFERQFENARRVSMREYVGNPSFKPLSEIRPEELAEELEMVLDYLDKYDIVLDFLCEVDEGEAYRFILEELMNEEVDDIHIKDMKTHFTYEDFHPNDEYDIKMWAEDFLLTLFNHHEEYLFFSDEELYDCFGNPTTQEQMKALVAAFYAQNRYISNFDFKPIAWQIERDYATVETAVSWYSLLPNSDEPTQTIGRAHFRLKRSPYDGWDIIQVKMPGL